MIIEVFQQVADSMGVAGKTNEFLSISCKIYTIIKSNKNDTINYAQIIYINLRKQVTTNFS